MAGISLRNLFRKKRSLSDISVDELHTEKVRIEREQRRFSERLNELEQRKKALFIAATNEPSERKRKELAVQIKDLELEARDAERQHAILGRHLRAINRFIQAKRSRQVEQMGLGRIIDRLDLDDLARYMEEASLRGEVQWDRLGEILGQLDQTERLAGELEEEEGVSDILRAIDEARAVAISDPEEAERLAAEKLDSLRHKEPEAPEEEAL